MKVVGKGRVEDVKLYGSSGGRNLGSTKFVRTTNDPQFGDRMRSIESVEKYAKEAFQKLNYNIWTESCQEFAKEILCYANYGQGSLATVMEYPAMVDPATDNWDIGNGY